MAIPDNTQADKVQQLNDLELAVLLCLVTDQHCIIEANHLDLLQDELKRIINTTFQLGCATVECSKDSSLEEFGNALLIGEDDYFDSHDPKSEDQKSTSPGSTRTRPRWQMRTSSNTVTISKRRLANVIIAKNLNLTQPGIQTQALELVRSKRIMTRSSMYAAPKRFLLIALQSKSSNHTLFSHLNNHFFFLHRHEDRGDHLVVDKEVTKSRAISFDDGPGRFSPTKESKSPVNQITHSDITSISEKMELVQMTSEIRAYMRDIVIFLRLHRAVDSGVSATSTRHFDLLARSLAPLHNMAFITPSLVALAARKIFLHRLQLTTPERERSLQWGSSLEAVRGLLEGLTVDDVIEDVLQSVEAPL